MTNAESRPPWLKKLSYISSKSSHASWDWRQAYSGWRSSELRLVTAASSLSNYIRNPPTWIKLKRTYENPFIFAKYETPAAGLQIYDLKTFTLYTHTTYWIFSRNQWINNLAQASRHNSAVHACTQPKFTQHVHTCKLCKICNNIVASSFSHTNIC